jgi:hypothetical protein
MHLGDLVIVSAAIEADHGMADDFIRALAQEPDRTLAAGHVDIFLQRGDKHSKFLRTKEPFDGVGISGMATGCSSHPP